jgi:uncharacterized protein YdeI (YjbR/CyaY-like superfamily)
MPSREAWQDWLAAHHESSDGVWLAIAKKGSGVASVTYDEALEVALCHGWVDGQKRAYDDAHWLQRFTPRRPRSIWSKRNRATAERLLAEGRMTPAGMRAIEQAKADGRWDAAYEGQRSATVPDDLRRALDADPAARAAFAGLDSRNRYAILFRVQQAKRPDTRARRIATYVSMLAAGETIYPRSSPR